MDTKDHHAKRLTDPQPAWMGSHAAEGQSHIPCGQQASIHAKIKHNIPKE